MKTKNLLATALIATVAFTSCDKSEDVGDLRKEVKIVASVGALTGNQTRASFQSDGSGEFEVGDEYVLNTYSPTLSSEARYQYEIGSTTLYWDEVSPDGSPVDFNAWYPVYNFFMGSPIRSYKVATAGTEDAKDLLMTPKVSVAKYNQVNLQFKHVMHKLTVVLSSNYYTPAQLNSATITLRNLKSDAMVDFNNGTVDKTAASGTDAYPSETGSRAEFVVAPQTLTAGTEIIEIVIDAKIYFYEVPAILTALESGQTLTLSLNLKQGGGVTGTIGEDFTPGGGHGGWN